eukprot:gnl/TRDRNA2_/TRDRNA2_177952_c3_seq2.p1 gnl/TRDRNA2_/TRDRNA2_177952_c3~~gnl/TRDRNA2_/TRDRNA2_177952_c3_seq2.p1  ORF type:complete len:716 (+),score=284.20 gnl/TRDRNA2_/TRDRNA2_177952_c3_seq2:94-2241(+)
MRAGFVLFFLALASVHAVETREKAMTTANPIRKIVTLMQNMQKKVEDEGKKEEELFEKFMCFCKQGRAGLEASVEKAKTSEIPDLEASVEEAVGKKKQMDEDLVQHKADKEAAKQSIADATAKREKEAAEFKKESEEQTADIAGLKKALEAVKAGTGGAFLQTADGGRIKQLVQDSKDILETDRDDLMAFLQGSEADSGQIVGIMETMIEEMSAALKEIEETEAKAISDFDSLVMEKTKEGESLQVMIEDKLTRTGELAVEVVELKNELEDTQESLAEDEKMLNGLEEKCAAKKKEWAERQKLRQEELLAIADTIKILNDDDALELFKKTLPSASASFVQIEVTSAAMRSKALELINQARHRPHRSQRLDFIALALRGKTAGFDFVVKMMEGMIANLKKEQEDDDAKKEYCLKEFDEAEDKKKSLETAISDLETAIADAEESITTLKTEIEALDDGIKALDKSVVEATEQRKEENEDFTANAAANAACKELIAFAKNRLNKFYNPKLYKPPAKRAITAEEQATLAAGGTLAPTVAPGGIAGTGVGLFVQIQMHRNDVAPPPPPETFGAYTKSEESGGVISMMDMMISDMDKEMREAEYEEKDAQKDYETMMKDSAEKRAEDSKTMTDKQSALAQVEGELQQHKSDKMSTGKQLQETMLYTARLHGDCDFLMQNYDARKEARNAEMESIRDAEDTLKGAEYSLVQSSRASRKLLRH